MRELISLRGDIHANRSVLPGSDKERRTVATSGRRCSELLHRQNPLGLFAKMLMATSQWVSTKCFLTWRVKTTPRSRLLFQLVESTRGTEEGDFGLWPTPTSGNTGGPTGLGGGSGNRKKIYKMVGEEEGKKMASGSLNPEWEEWLMGYPTGWTELDP